MLGARVRLYATFAGHLWILGLRSCGYWCGLYKPRGRPSAGQGRDGSTIKGGVAPCSPKGPGKLRDIKRQYRDYWTYLDIIRLLDYS